MTKPSYLLDRFGASNEFQPIKYFPIIEYRICLHETTDAFKLSRDDESKIEKFKTLSLMRIDPRLMLKLLFRQYIRHVCLLFNIMLLLNFSF